jgi:hypothetical protein
MLLHNPTTVGGKTEAKSNGRKLNQFSDEHLLPNRIPIQSERLLRSLCESLLQSTGNRTFSNHRRKDHSGTSSESEVVTTGKNCGSRSTGSAAKETLNKPGHWGSSCLACRGKCSDSGFPRSPVRFSGSPMISNRRGQVRLVPEAAVFSAASTDSPARTPRTVGWHFS